MAKRSPTQLTLEHFERAGYLADVCERANARRRFDLFGMFDIVAIGYGDTIGIQVTTASNMAARVRKLTEHENIGAVRDAGWQILVHGWRKNGTLREVDLS